MVLWSREHHITGGHVIISVWLSNQLSTRHCLPLTIIAELKIRWSDKSGTEDGDAGEKSRVYFDGE